VVTYVFEFQEMAPHLLAVISKQSQRMKLLSVLSLLEVLLPVHLLLISYLMPSLLVLV